jgi:hypothetical protein
MKFKMIVESVVLWSAFAAVPGAQVTPVKAIRFLNSIGVCTHLVQGIDNPRQVADALRYAGFRHVREDGTRNRTLLALLVEIHQKTGVTFDELPALTSIGSDDISASLAEYEQLAAAGALLSVEGPNEPNNFPVRYQGVRSGVNTTFSPVAHYQHDLYAAVKADPHLAGYPVFASSEAGGAEPDNQGLQFLTIPTGAGTLMPAGTIYADYANVHNYVQGNGMRAPRDNTAWGAEADGAPAGTWDGLFGEYGITWHKSFKGYTIAQLKAVPKVTTETGWPTAGTNSISEEQQGALLTNLYLSAVARKWTYTFIYMLVDEPQAGNGFYGLFHRDYTPKLSATYLHNLTRILADENSAFTPRRFTYYVPDQPRTVHTLLMQKSNGLYDLAVWADTISPSTDMSLSMESVLRSVKVYDVTRGVLPIRTLRDVAVVPLTLSNHALILEFAAGGNRVEHERTD